MNKKKSSIKVITDLVAGRLKENGIKESAGEARQLISLATGLTREKIIGYPERRLRQSEIQKLKNFLKLRCDRKPMSQIVGLREFWSMNFFIDEDVLDPRPDSETLVETVLDYFPNKNTRLKILDLGTGSGCLLLSLLKEFSNAYGVGTDINRKSCLVAIENSRRFKLLSRSSFLVCDWCESLDTKFDIILANPPYLTDKEMQNLEPEIFNFEPHGALSGGVDGLDSYKNLIPQVRKFFSRESIFFLEIAPGLSPQIKTILGKNELKVLAMKKDLSQKARCFVIGT